MEHDDDLHAPHADDHAGHLHETRGSIRSLTRAERYRLPGGRRACCFCCHGWCGCCCNGYNYVVTEPYTLQWHGRTVTVPAGFLTNGSSGGPDLGTSWLYHDHLYATHAFSSGEPCTRAEADQVMADVLGNDRMYVYCWIFHTLSRLNPFWLFSGAWDYSRRRGVELFASDEESFLTGGESP